MFHPLFLDGRLSWSWTGVDAGKRRPAASGRLPSCANVSHPAPPEPGPASLARSTGGSFELEARALKPPRPRMELKTGASHPARCNFGAVTLPTSSVGLRISEPVPLTRQPVFLRAGYSSTVDVPMAMEPMDDGYATPASISRAPTRCRQMQDHLEIAAPDWVFLCSKLSLGKGFRTLPESAMGFVVLTLRVFHQPTEAPLADDCEAEIVVNYVRFSAASRGWPAQLLGEAANQMPSKPFCLRMGELKETGVIGTGFSSAYSAHAQLPACGVGFVSIIVELEGLTEQSSHTAADRLEREDTGTDSLRASTFVCGRKKQPMVGSPTTPVHKSVTD
ncbi:hypothetical protein BDP67DRAFT_486725 [Colletotrichum lupini]|nr:hypothetical protein BDP67DRAFT_486725 [Colletotrichum lupini]